jgi:aryl-alcohol dehydrogenase-like predicted oxidoreductase
LMTFLKAADEHGLPRIASIQNAYNLVNRTFEIGHSEIAQREGVSLLGYSPLGQGYLTGNMKAARCRRARARHCSTVSGVMRRETDLRRSRLMSPSRGSTASTRRKWRSLSPCRGRL